MSLRLLGVGSPLVDYSAQVPEEFIRSRLSGGKGGTRNIGPAEKAELLAVCPGPVTVSAGGAAANTVMAASELGVRGALLGKLGCDADGERFLRDMRMAGADVSELRTDPDTATGYCVALVTPDAERTMRSDLGASLNLTPAEVGQCDFSRYDRVLLEGYFVNTDIFEPVMLRARAAGVGVAVDLCNYELVTAGRERFTRLIARYADMVFANRDEAAALTGKKEPDPMARALAKICRTAVVKLGADGAIIASENRLEAVPPVRVGRVVDTTAAGDYFAAGFFYALGRGRSAARCGAAGARCAAEIIQYPGTKLPREAWNKLKAELEAL
ncbi:MAG: adenosine kinase [Lentisphaeria bacterium]|nr:adenosine kinase [Lentisphaeria bacterium]